MEKYIIICALILSLGLLIMYIKQSIIERYVYKEKMSLAFFIIFSILLSYLFMDNIFKYNENKTIYHIFYAIIFVLITILFIFNSSQMTKKKSINKQLINTIEEDKLFILLDKKERIKEISSLLAKKLCIEKDLVIQKNFFEMSKTYFEIVSINGISVTVDKTIEIFKENASLFSKMPKTKKEMIIINNKEERIILNFSDICIVNSSKYCGHILIGDSSNEDNLLNAEKDLLERNEELQNIKTRFITHLDITNQAIFFHNIEQNYMWINDNACEVLNLESNTIIKDLYNDYIHKDDLAYYNSVINSLTKDNDNYEVKYRFKTGVNYEFVREVGKRTFNKEEDEIVGYVEIINSNHYERSNIEVLDNIHSIEELNKDCKRLYEEKRTFELVTMKLDSIDKINKTGGRAVGNMVMAEYIKAILKNFIDDGYIYRISGLEFVFIITDYRKMDLIKKALTNNSITKTTMNYGSIKLDLEVYFGLSFSTEVSNYEDLVKLNYKALNMALLPRISGNYFYSQELLNV